MLPKAPVVMLKTVVVPAAGMATDPGTVTAELLLDRVIVAPPDPAACGRVTVQVAEAFGPSVEGVQTSVGFARPITTAARLMVEFTENPL